MESTVISVLAGLLFGSVVWNIVLAYNWRQDVKMHKEFVEDWKRLASRR